MKINVFPANNFAHLEKSTTFAAGLENCSIMDTKETKQEQIKRKSLWELAKEWKGNLIVNDPIFLL